MLLWICSIKIMYQNHQCLHMNYKNSLERKLTNSSNVLMIDSRLKLNHFVIIGTHNSYHKESLLYKYKHSNLDNQFKIGIRQIELDIHLMSNNNLVYHLQIFDDKTNCYCLNNCLKRILNWSRNNSNHYPIYLFIEIKQKFYEDLFTSLNGGVKCKHFQMIKQQILQVFSIDTLILSQHIRGNQTSIHLALKKQRQNEFYGNFTYEYYGWPPVYLSLGKIIPIFIDDVHNIAEKLISTCEPLANFFLIAQQKLNLDYSSIIRISNPLRNKHLIIQSINNGLITRVLLGYNGKKLIQKYKQARLYGVHIISTDSVQCNNTILCRSLINDFKTNASILCNQSIAPSFCNTTMLVM
jgi:hypothetical protein